MISKGALGGSPRSQLKFMQSSSQSWWQRQDLDGAIVISQNVSDSPSAFALYSTRLELGQYPEVLRLVPVL